ncbi:sulfotransferase [Congregibacter brevis]|uniref:Sulfotransferase n=1 Tax=Congregibacter brevis TaxID=3081201 RepID=A0ABZ0IAN2_9GAMM|nr:sulfotransferase [Congregibacter sp. IMCC45268]
MQVFGAGVGRTGTMSLRTALQQLGLGPCYHMEVVLNNPAVHVPLWNAVVAGQADWSAIYQGQQSAVDWPTASFYPELHAAFPHAKFVLTHRDPDSWVASISETIFTALLSRDDAPAEAQPWLDMCMKVIARSGFDPAMSKDELAARFFAHTEAVKAAIPAKQLLLFQVKEGWGPLCEFLGVETPATEFPRTNDRAQFWQLLEDGGATVEE